MNKTNNKTKTIVKGTAFAFATLLSMSAFPMTQIFSASADTAIDNSSIVLLNAGNTTVDAGSNFDIRLAYLNNGTALDGSDDVVVKDENNKEVAATFALENEGSTNPDAVWGSFKASNIGTYTVLYTHTDGAQTLTKELKIESVKPDVTMGFKEDKTLIVPKIYDLAQVKTEKKIVLPEVEVFNTDEEKIAVKFTVGVPADADTDYVKVTAKIDEQDVSAAVEDNKIVVTALKEGKLTITYQYFKKKSGETADKAVFVESFTQKIDIEDGYYAKDYKLKASLSSSRDFETGVEAKIPTLNVNATFEDADGNSQNEEIEVSMIEIKIYKETSKNVFDTEVAASEFDGENFTPYADGNYKFVYKATDIYGNEIIFDSFTPSSSNVKAPEIIAYDSADNSNTIDENKKDNNLTDVFDDLKARTHVNNVYVYAIGAKDNASVFKNVELSREIENSGYDKITIPAMFNKYNLVLNYNYAEIDERDVFGKAFKKADETLKNAGLINAKVLKVITQLTVDLKTDLEADNVIFDTEDDNYDLEVLQTKLIEMGYAYIPSSIFEVEEGKLSVKYISKNKAGKKATKTHNFSLVESKLSEDDVKRTEIEFKTVLSPTYSSTDIVSFDAPIITDKDEDGHIIDKNVDLTVSYQLYSNTSQIEANKLGNPVVLEEENGKYEINIADVIASNATAKSVKIIVKTVNDYSYETFLYRSFDIVDINDTTAPTVVFANTGTDADVYQNEMISLPTITYTENYVDSLNIDVDVYHIDGENKKEVDISYDSGDIKGNEYTLAEIKFLAIQAGDYEVCVTATDVGGNSVSSYFFCKATKEDSNTTDFKIIAPKSINDGKATVGEEITFDIPKLKEFTYDKNDFGLIGIDEENGNVFENYQIKYTNAQSVIKSSKANTFVFEKAGDYEFWYVASFETEDKTQSPSVFEDKVLTSDRIKITVSEGDVSTGKYAVNFGSYGEWDEHYGKDETIKIFSVGGLNKAEIDVEKSYIDIVTPSGRSLSRRFIKDFKTGSDGYDATSNTFDLELSEDGAYKITYKIIDIDGNTLVNEDGNSSYTIKVGDDVDPTITIKDEYVKDEYKLNENVTFDFANITFEDNKELTPEKIEETLEIRISRKNDDGNFQTVEVFHGVDAKNIDYKFNVAGEYKISVSVEDAVGNEETKDKLFTVAAKSSNPTVSSNSIVGIVLITLSVLILGGVIAYFMISSLKAKGKIKPRSKKNNKIVK